MAGRYNFTIPGRPDASIVNQGSITATSGGFAALVAPGVRNTGTITATLGTVSLASGNTFTLDLYGDKLIQLAPGDEIASKVIDVATGKPLSSLVSNEGTLKANGGRVELTAVAARAVVEFGHQQHRRDRSQFRGHARRQDRARRRDCRHETGGRPEADREDLRHGFGGRQGEGHQGRHHRRDRREHRGQGRQDRRLGPSRRRQGHARRRLGGRQADARPREQPERHARELRRSRPRRRSASTRRASSTPPPKPPATAAR